MPSRADGENCPLWLPGILNHRGYSLDRLASLMTLGTEGIFGIPLGVAATFVFTFVLFGSFLEVTGAGKFFIDLAHVSTGRQRGGPAKSAVIESAGVRSISGSAIANVVTKRAFTISLMKNSAIVVSVVGLTGLGLKFSAMMLAFSGVNFVLALILVLLASLVLGMGLPVSAAYVVLIILVGLALTEEFGVPLLIADLFVF